MQSVPLRPDLLGVALTERRVFISTISFAREVVKIHGGSIATLPEQESRRRKNDARFVVTYWETT